MTNREAVRIAVDCIKTLRPNLDEMKVNINLDETVEKLEKILASYEKKPKKENPEAQEERTTILAYLTKNGAHLTATEILDIFPEFKNNQKVSQILRALRLDNKVDRETIKGKTYYYAI